MEYFDKISCEQHLCINLQLFEILTHLTTWAFRELLNLLRLLFFENWPPSKMYGKVTNFIKS